MGTEPAIIQHHDVNYFPPLYKAHVVEEEAKVKKGGSHSICWIIALLPNGTLPMVQVETSLIHLMACFHFYPVPNPLPPALFLLFGFFPGIRKNNTNQHQLEDASGVRFWEEVYFKSLSRFFGAEVQVQGAEMLVGYGIVPSW